MYQQVGPFVCNCGKTFPYCGPEASYHIFNECLQQQWPPAGPDNNVIPEPNEALKKLMQPTAGKKFDQEKNRVELISPFALEELGKVLTFGAKKYDARNWENGIHFSRILGAILRHTYAYMRGETRDPETGLSHMAHAMCECMFLLHFERTKPDFDDRPKYEDHK